MAGPAFAPATAASAPSATPAVASVPVPAPIPSLVTGQAACDACLEAAAAGHFLSAQGVGHYLAGCDDPPRKQQCLRTTKLALPVRAKAFVRDGHCDDAKTLAEFGVRSGTSSPQLVAVVKPCVH